MTEGCPEDAYIWGESTPFYMATSNGLLVKGMSGAIGDELVLKQYKYGMVVSRYPDMSKVKASTLQKENRNLFRDAHYHAQGINRDPVKKAAFKKTMKKGETSVYFVALTRYMNDHKQGQ
jgi:hypothetical protein